MVSAISKTREVSTKGADKPGDLKAALEASARAQALVPTLDEFAEQEADEIVKSTGTRAQIWLSVWRAYGTTDFPSLESYPNKVRHAYAKRIGIDMSISRKLWAENHKKLYSSFCANTSQQFQFFVDVAKKAQTAHLPGAEMVIRLLEGPGTLVAKVEQAKIALGKAPAKKGADQNGSHGANGAESGGTTSTDAKPGPEKHWSETMTNLKTKSPLEAAAALVTFMPYNDCMRLVQVIGKRMETSGDALDKMLGEKLSQDVVVYLTKAEK